MYWYCNPYTIYLVIFFLLFCGARWGGRGHGRSNGGDSYLVFVVGC